MSTALFVARSWCVRLATRPEVNGIDVTAMSSGRNGGDFPDPIALAYWSDSRSELDGEENPT
jgi:hypothetical protein